MHDSQRVEDGRDPGHGERAVATVKNHPVTALLDASQRQKLYTALRHHSDGEVRGCPVVRRT
jgi:hypothetical protein